MLVRKREILFHILGTPVSELFWFTLVSVYLQLHLSSPWFQTTSRHALVMWTWNISRCRLRLQARSDFLSKLIFISVMPKWTLLRLLSLCKLYSGRFRVFCFGTMYIDTCWVFVNEQVLMRSFTYIPLFHSFLSYELSWSLL